MSDKNFDKKTLNDQSFYNADLEGATRLRAQLETVSTDVCQYRDRDRLSPTRPIGPVRALDGGSVPPALCRRPDAAPRSAARLTPRRTM